MTAKTFFQASPHASLGHLAAISGALSPVADGVGSSRFLRALFDCVSEFAECDTLHLMRMRATCADGQSRRLEWIGSYGDNLDELHRTMALYSGNFGSRDPLVGRMHESGSQDVELIQISANAIEDLEFRQSIYDVGDIHEECIVVRFSRGTYYSLSICRARRLPPFSLTELGMLRHLGQVLLPLVELHTRQSGVAQGNSDAIETPDALTAYITRNGIALSLREASVCSAFVKGMTTASFAETMGLKPSTVETYTKRAFAKLGVTSRRELLSLVHGQR
jgi:DNA-binding CsgD family transcriptional regulator